jgi:hypothetical protein
MVSTMRYLPLLFLAGCASVPIGDYPRSALEECQQMASQYNMEARPLMRGAVGAATGVLADRALEGAAFKILGYTAPLHMGSLVPPLAIYGIGVGLIEAQDRKDQIVKECLRDKGHKAY